MKAKIYNFENNSQILVKNKIYNKLENENKKDFIKRIQNELEKDFDEYIEIVEFDNKTYEQYNDNLLTQAYISSNGLQELIIKEILKSRNIEINKIVKVSKSKVEKRDLDEMKASKEYQDAKANINKLATFTPNKAEIQLTGVVKSISLNKTNTQIYYNILCNDTLKCCTTNNKTLEFFEF